VPRPWPQSFREGFIGRASIRCPRQPSLRRNAPQNFADVSVVCEPRSRFVAAAATGIRTSGDSALRQASPCTEASVLKPNCSTSLTEGRSFLRHCWHRLRPGLVTLFMTRPFHRTLRMVSSDRRVGHALRAEHRRRHRDDHLLAEGAAVTHLPSPIEVPGQSTRDHGTRSGTCTAALPESRSGRRPGNRRGPYAGICSGKGHAPVSSSGRSSPWRRFVHRLVILDSPVEEASSSSINRLHCARRRGGASEKLNDYARGAPMMSRHGCWTHQLSLDWTEMSAVGPLFHPLEL